MEIVPGNSLSNAILLVMRGTVPVCCSATGSCLAAEQRPLRCSSTAPEDAASKRPTYCNSGIWAELERRSGISDANN